MKYQGREYLDADLDLRNRNIEATKKAIAQGRASEADLAAASMAPEKRRELLMSTEIGRQILAEQDAETARKANAVSGDARSKYSVILPGYR